VPRKPPCEGANNAQDAKQHNTSAGEQPTECKSKTERKSDTSTRAGTAQDNAQTNAVRVRHTGTTRRPIAWANHVHEVHGAQAHHAVQHRHNSLVTTPIASWLVDSGCSAHMTPNIDGLVEDIEPYDTIVETANGGQVKCHMRGTAQILIQDIFDQNKRLVVLVEHVLHVPGLNRRLLSVREWNHSGGSVTFLADRCRLKIVDESRDTKHTLDIGLPFADGQFIDEVHNADVQPRAKIATTLLHQRLGHRAVSALLLADEDRIWADVDVVPDPEEFCDICRITTA
jgi:hypothetical protein